MGSQVSSRSHSTSSYRIGTSQRFFHDKGVADAGPAPGTYRTPRAMGKQMSSQKPTYPTRLAPSQPLTRARARARALTQALAPIQPES